jgi:hypothetical protein
MSISRKANDFLRQMHYFRTTRAFRDEIELEAIDEERWGNEF